MTKKKTLRKPKKHEPLTGFSLQSLASEVGLNTELVTLAHAAKIRGTVEVSMLELIHRGRLKAIKIGGRWFLSREEVEAFEPQTWKKKKSPKQR